MKSLKKRKSGDACTSSPPWHWAAASSLALATVERDHSLDLSAGQLIIPLIVTLINNLLENYKPSKNFFNHENFNTKWLALNHHELRSKRYRSSVELANKMFSLLCKRSSPRFAKNFVRICYYLIEMLEHRLDSYNRNGTIHGASNFQPKRTMAMATLERKINQNQLPRRR